MVWAVIANYHPVRFELAIDTAWEYVFFMTSSIQRASRIVVLLFGIGLVWLNTSGFDGSEFSGGWVTGRLLNIAEVGTLALALAMILANWFRKASAAIALVASLCCLPLLLYFIAPGPFRSMFKGEYSVPLQTAFVWNLRPVAAIISIVVICAVSVGSLFPPRTMTAPNG